MIIRNGRKQAILLLLALSLISFGIVKITKPLNLSNQRAWRIVKQDSNSYDNSAYTEEIVEKDQGIELTSNSKQEEGDVKGALQANCGAISPSQFLASVKSICSSGSGAIEIERKLGQKTKYIQVNENVTVEITRVEMPLAFWLGQSRYRDSNKAISIKTPEYRANGEQIDPESVSKLLSPQQSKEYNENIVRNQETPFSVEGTVTFSGKLSNSVSTPGEYMISNVSSNPRTSCYGVPNREVAISDYNVGQANYIASDMEGGGYGMFQIPGGDNFIVEDQKECLDYNSMEIVEDGVVTVCEREAATIKGLFSKLFNTEVECTEEELVNETGANYRCIDPNNIGIRMTPIFGDPYECTGELCANAFLVDSYRATLSPLQASSMNPIFTVATDCAVSINGKEYGVKCLWDASPTWLNYYLQRKDKSPKQEDFPLTFDFYWQGIDKAIKMSADDYGL